MGDDLAVEQPRSGAEVRVAATVPLGSPPTWAVLQRRLFDVLDEAWRVFERRYCEPDGRLAYRDHPMGRDGADDFYEPFFNWPALYLLGGSSDVLDAAKRHWHGITAQLTELGLLKDEFDRGYDWFHQGESLLFLYGICAADPRDPDFRERAERFARLYLAGAPEGNYDAELNIIRAPHNGADGPRPGLGEEMDAFPPDADIFHPYGLPLHDVPGITGWDDLADDVKARTMGQAMRERLGRGDTAINLCATSLLTNAWLYGNDAAYAEWITTYVRGWLSRARDLGGVFPDNVGLSGKVGEYHDGRWYGGHYGWTWPHGYHTVGAAALIGGMNAAFVSGDAGLLELARLPLRQVMEQRRPGVVPETEMSQRRPWTERLADEAKLPVMLYPHRHGPSGWFDFQPMQTAFPTWLWWYSMEKGDAEVLRDIGARSGYDWARVRAFRDKEEAGHETPWLAYLNGDNPRYPEEALAMAAAQAAHRLSLVAADDERDVEDIHWWQRKNPVVTEVLTQLTTGAPQVLYNGGLQHARLRYGDAEAGRPGLPPDVAALIDHLDDRSTHVTLVNLSPTRPRLLWLSAGAFGEHRIDRVTYDRREDSHPGDPLGYALPAPAAERFSLSVDGPRLVVSLPPAHTIRLELDMTLRAYPPRHQTFDAIRPSENNS
ncbi:hypothetical protein ACIBHX_45340 [Nonomuraea sp. NPDC050536]|uniref:hypothetical protein n=1 Tax=Nonomuraea sp. NPDC050536 TaxID=3364366 RepID=UPI0037C7B49C